jgi:hypothetical protein
MNSYEPEPEAEERAGDRHRGRREPQGSADHDHGCTGQWIIVAIFRIGA